jgi:hypothetical protein
MTYSFPFDAALLPRTKLAFANLPGILADGKRDRQSRVPGYVAVQLGERCYLVFLREGEPFFGARITPVDRAPAALSEVLRLAAMECERGEGGQIGFYAASEEQLMAMLSTLVGAPLPLGAELDASAPERLFPVLRDRAFTGVLELVARDGAHHYLLFRRGAFHSGWFTGRTSSVALPQLIRSLFDGPPPAVALYPLLDALPVHAGPGYVDLYRRVVGATLREVALSTGRDAALELVQRAQRAVGADHPVVAAFEVTGEGRVAGDPVASPDGLTDGVATWVTEVLIAASDEHGVDPGAVIEKVGRDSRFVLQEHGFFSRLPWALAI